MAASNNSTNDTLLAQFYMDDYNRKVQQDKRALQARNNTTAPKPNITDKSETQEKVVEKPPFDHAAFLAWAKSPVKKEELPLDKRPYDHAEFLAWAKGPVETEEQVVNNKRNSSPFRLRTF